MGNCPPVIDCWPMMVPAAWPTCWSTRVTTVTASGVSAIFSLLVTVPVTEAAAADAVGPAWARTGAIRASRTASMSVRRIV